MTVRISQALASSGNRLYPYARNTAVYHCPGDLRCNRVPGNGWAYDSYSKTANVAGEAWGDTPYTKLSQIRNSAMTFLTVEDSDPRGYNVGTWVVNWITSTTPGSFTWVDTPAIYHLDANSFSFADGHVEMHKWIS